MSNAIAKRNGDLTLPGVTLTATGLQFDDGITFGQWKTIGQYLRQASHALHWSIGDWLLCGEGRPEWGDKYEAAIEEFGFEYGTLANDKRRAKEFESSRRRENLTESHHDAVAGLEPAEQDQWLDRCETDGLKVGQIRAELRKQRLLQDRIQNPLPDGKHRVLYADPPWRYGDERLGLDGYSGAAEHYPTMTTDELCELRDDQGREVVDMAHSDAVLFLWATTPLLFEAGKVIDAWGFTYKQTMVWDKGRGDFGHYVDPHCEQLLIATRGSCLPEADPKQRQLVQIKRTPNHSQKPGEFYGIIERMYPHGPRLELFARNTRPGWTSWGVTRRSQPARDRRRAKPV